jgi:hypothetical protein
MTRIPAAKPARKADKAIPALEDESLGSAVMVLS